MRRKKLKWSFENMHQSLQIISFILGGLGFIGWTITGIWLLALVMGY